MVSIGQDLCGYKVIADLVSGFFLCITYFKIYFYEARVNKETIDDVKEAFLEKKH